MEPAQASRTAMLVAYMRALADAGASHVPGFRDPTARVFLNEKWTRRLANIQERVRTGQRGLKFEFAQVAADLMALRTAVIDAAVCDAVAQSIRQVVILGAGLDGRAWRMNELAGTHVFEVDHPATQAFKRARVTALPDPIARVTFVPVDFERDELDTVLEQAGHDRARPTTWIWEGVVMYLTLDAMRSTLASVGGRSAAGSILVVNYHTGLRRAIGWLLERIGEPVKSRWSPAEMAADLQHAGFVITDDSGVAEWTTRFASGPVNPRAGRLMRIATGVRRA